MLYKYVFFWRYVIIILKLICFLLPYFTQKISQWIPHWGGGPQCFFRKKCKKSIFSKVSIFQSRYDGRFKAALPVLLRPLKGFFATLFGRKCQKTTKKSQFWAIFATWVIRFCNFFFDFDFLYCIGLLYFEFLYLFFICRGFVGVFNFRFCRGFLRFYMSIWQISVFL